MRANRSGGTSGVIAYHLRQWLREDRKEVAEAEEEAGETEGGIASGAEETEMT